MHYCLYGSSASYQLSTTFIYLPWWLYNIWIMAILTSFIGGWPNALHVFIHNNHLQQSGKQWRYFYPFLLPLLYSTKGELNVIYQFFTQSNLVKIFDLVVNKRFRLVHFGAELLSSYKNKTWFIKISNRVAVICMKPILMGKMLKD